MARVLILLAHPTLHKSRVNRAMVAAAERIDGATVHDLYERYPDFHIAVEAEQALLRTHDAVVFQHPMYWYSSPALLKEWQDVVLEYGFAFGERGTALSGKLFMQATSAGGPDGMYARGEANHFSIRELLTPFEQTARLCRMRVLPPFVVHGSDQLTREQLSAAGSEYAAIIAAMCAGKLDYRAAEGRRYINDGPVPVSGGGR